MIKKTTNIVPQNIKEPSTTQTKVLERIKSFNLAEYIKCLLHKPEPTFWFTFLTTFIALGITFLYFGTHLMFGDHDWRYIKDGIPLSAGLFEGRFTQFIPINLLSFGEILPIINNILGFAGYALGIALLARYLQVPQKRSYRAIFALFFALSPYILSFMYFAFLVIPVLGWNAFIIGALILSEKETKFDIWYTTSSVILITFALGGYPPVINLFATALGLRLLIVSANNHLKINLYRLIINYRWSIINFLIAAGVYKIFLIYFTHTGAINPNYYNLQTTPISEWGTKAILVLKDAIMQLTATLPFITIPYKTSTLILTLAGIICILYSVRKNHNYTCIIILIACFLAPLITLFLSTSIRETEFSPRIDFFGLMYLYGGMLAISLKTENKLIKNIGITSAIIATYFGAINIYEAEKVWKLGFDNELKLYRRIGKRFMSSPNFHKERKYIIVQDSDARTLRSRYYHESYKINSDDLLSIPYVPGMNASVMWNFYNHPEFGDKPAYVYRFNPDESAKIALRNAKPWPAPESTAVGEYWIMYFLSKTAITELQQRYLP